MAYECRRDELIRHPLACQSTASFVARHPHHFSKASQLSEPIGLQLQRKKIWTSAANFPLSGHPVMIPLKTILLLVGSNIFMTFAWYAHLKDMRSKPLVVAIVVSWLIAFFEYSLQVPANRLGYGTFTLPQLKIIQEVITLAIFIPFAVFYMGTPITWNYFFAGICLFGAVFFIFRDPAPVRDHSAVEPTKVTEDSAGRPPVHPGS